MKSVKLVALSFFTLPLLTACNADFDLNTIFSGSISDVTITIADADYTETINTRSSHSVDPSRGFVTTWTEGDTIGIYPIGADQVAFPISGGEGGSTAKFDGGAWSLRASRQYGAYYPFSKKNYYIDETKIPISYLGQKQTGNNNLDHLSDYDFMAAAAVSPDANGAVNITLQHLGAFLRLTITAPEAKTYTKVCLSSDAAIFTTDATINLQDGSLTPTKKADVLSLLLDNVTTTAPNQTITAYMMLAPISASDISAHPISVTLFDDNGVSYVADLTFTSVVAGKSYAKSAFVQLNEFDATKIESWAVIPDYLHISINGIIKDDKLLSEKYEIFIETTNEYGLVQYKVDFNENEFTTVLRGNKPVVEVHSEKPTQDETFTYRIAIHDKSNDTTVYSPYYSTTLPIFQAVEPTSGNLIDMGLSVKWCRYNLGSSYSSPECQGYHFAFGEIEPKQSFTLENYLYQSGGQYVDLEWNNEWSISGDPRYDPSGRYYSEGCRIPTASEMRELYEECDWYWTVYNGIKGFQIVGPSGNNIFLPCEEGNGYECDHYQNNITRYWTSTVWDSNFMSFCAYGLRISHGDVDDPLSYIVWCYPNGMMYYEARYVGCPIRPVCDY